MLTKRVLETQQEDKSQWLRDLMALVAEKRDRVAFGQLFDHFAPMLRAYSLAQQPGAHLIADEIAQEGIRV